MSETTVDPATCCICTGQVPSGEGKGTLPQCSHDFCFDCIATWAKEKPLCPLCQKEFDVVMREGVEVKVELGDVKQYLSNEAVNASCLDHTYFMAEINNLLESVERAQLLSLRARSVTREKAVASLDHIGQRLYEICEVLTAVEQFDPDSLLSELYQYNDVVDRVSKGSSVDQFYDSFVIQSNKPKRYGADDWEEEEYYDYEEDYGYDDMGDEDMNTFGSYLQTAKYTPKNSGGKRRSQVKQTAG